MHGQRAPGLLLQTVLSFGVLRLFSSLENKLSNLKKLYFLIIIHWLACIIFSKFINPNTFYQTMYISKLKNNVVISFLNWSNNSLNSKFIINLCVNFIFHFQILIQNKLSVWNTGTFFVLFCFLWPTSLHQLLFLYDWNSKCALHWFRVPFKSHQISVAIYFFKEIKAHRLCTDLFPLILKPQWNAQASGLPEGHCVRTEDYVLYFFLLF